MLGPFVIPCGHLPCYRHAPILRRLSPSHHAQHTHIGHSSIRLSPGPLLAVRRHATGDAMAIPRSKPLDRGSKARQASGQAPRPDVPDRRSVDRQDRHGDDSGAGRPGAPRPHPKAGRKRPAAIGCRSWVGPEEAVGLDSHEGRSLYSSTIPSKASSDRGLVMPQRAALPRRSSTTVAIVWGVLHRVPNGYCPHTSTGVGCPAWGSGLIPQEASATS